MQTALAEAPRARQTKYGDAKWKMVTDQAVVDNAALDKIFGLNPPDVIEVAKMVAPAIVSKLKSLEQGGGGWAMANAARGKTSSVTGDIVWTLRCRSFHSYECPAKVKVVYRSATRTMHLEHAEGWLHVHSGALQTQQGLPPSVKMLVDGIIEKHPGIKLKALKNLLWEVHQISKDEFETRVHSYFYKGCKERRVSAHTGTGMSSFGAAKSFAESHWLLDLLPEHVVSTNCGYLDAPGVIGYHVEPAESKCYVVFSTPKLLLDTFLQSVSGYSKGQLHIDFTFKLLQEQVPFFVSSVPDIQQHVHPGVMGPCTHQDAPTVGLILDDMKRMLERFVKMIVNNNDEHWGNWPAPLRDALVDTYRQHIIRGITHRLGNGIAINPDTDLYFYPRRLMSDDATALINGARIVMPNIEDAMCWPHVWRGVKLNYYRLRTNTPERQKQLFTDLNFIHECTVIEIIPQALSLFYQKWIALGEKPMMDYIQNQWGEKKWMRAYGDPGEPSDNNTLESLNRTLKTDSAFGKTTSLALCLNQCLVTMHRLSRDTKSIFSAEAPVVKKEHWVKAQKLVSNCYFKLGYRMNEAIVIPSSKLLDQCPGSTVMEKRQNMSVWVKEYISMMKNPGGYYKVHSTNGWPFDALVDYLFSFWILKKIVPAEQPNYAALAAEGILYTCNCPQFMHYHHCKHVIGYALYESDLQVPTHYSTLTVGKRKAPEGAKPTKRGHCLLIDK